jgi:brassinosteroid-6-oxidase 1
MYFYHNSNKKNIPFVNGRFGSFFKSHILGSPTIVSMDPELNRYILLNESKGLVPGYPQSMLDILGKCNIAAVHGSTHKYMRGALLSIISPTMIRDQILPKLDEFMSAQLRNWDDKIINIQEKTKEVCSFILIHIQCFENRTRHRTIN